MALTSGAPGAPEGSGGIQTGAKSADSFDGSTCLVKEAHEASPSIRSGHRARRHSLSSPRRSRDALYEAHAHLRTAIVLQEQAMSSVVHGGRAADDEGSRCHEPVTLRHASPRRAGASTVMLAGSEALHGTGQRHYFGEALPCRVPFHRVARDLSPPKSPAHGSGLVRPASAPRLMRTTPRGTTVQRRGMSPVGQAALRGSLQIGGSVAF